MDLNAIKQNSPAVVLGPAKAGARAWVREDKKVGPGNDRPKVVNGNSKAGKQVAA